MKVFADLVGICEHLLLVFTNYSVSDFVATETDEDHQELEILGWKSSAYCPASVSWLFCSWCRILMDI